MDSLQSKIGQGEAISTDLASYQTWIDRNGHNASLNELSKTLDDVTAQVSEYICYVLEKFENQRLLDGPSVKLACRRGHIPSVARQLHVIYGRFTVVFIVIF